MKIITQTSLVPHEYLNVTVKKEDSEVELTTNELEDLVAVLQNTLIYKKKIDSLKTIQNGKLYSMSGFYYLAKVTGGLVYFVHSDKDGIPHGDWFGASRIDVQNLRLAKKQPNLTLA